jgi:hypothetical protein
MQDGRTALRDRDFLMIRFRPGSVIRHREIVIDGG